LGHSPNQLPNFFAVGNFDTSGPISLTKVNAVNSLIPSISVKSSPTTYYNAVRTSKRSELTRRFGRVFGFSGGKARVVPVPPGQGLGDLRLAGFTTLIPVLD
jgi:hypothetical protein